MLLRASGQQDNKTYNLDAVTDETSDVGVEHGGLLRQLTQAAIDGQWDTLDTLRRNACDTMSEQQVVDALTVAAAFNGITRVADATGIPLDDNTAQTTSQMRETTGIDEFAYDRKSARYS